MMSVLGAARCPWSEVSDLAEAKELLLLVMGQVLSCFNVIFLLPMKSVEAQEPRQQ